MIAEHTQQLASKLNEYYRSNDWSANEVTATPWASPDGLKQRIYFNGTRSRGYLDFKNGEWLRVNTYTGSFGACITTVLSREAAHA